MLFRAHRKAALTGLAALLAMVALGSSACGRKTENAAPPAPVLGPEHKFALKIGNEVVQVRLAVHVSEQQRGLMEVTAMPEDEGMLFVYAQPQEMSFYMRNTRLPLDIGFLDAKGVLREIHGMFPGVEDSVKSRTRDMQFALEMNHGWFGRHRVAPGATLEMAPLRDALRKRGYNPDKFLPAP